MTHLPDPAPTSDPAAETFERLRSEVSLVRAAVEGLTAARERIPDYSSSLGKIVEAQKLQASQLEIIATKPALILTPERLVQEYSRASQAARAEDRALLASTRDEFNRALGKLDAMIKRGQAVEAVQRNYLYCLAVGVILGALIWNVAAALIS